MISSLINEFNKSSTPYPSDKTIIHLFEDQVEKTPHKEAIRMGVISLTYQELNARANQMAAKLNSIDVKEENLVVLYMDHSIEVICSILGVLKAGAGYVPIDITTPKNRISFILEDIEKLKLDCIDPLAMMINQIEKISENETINNIWTNEHSNLLIDYLH